MNTTHFLYVIEVIWVGRRELEEKLLRDLEPVVVSSGAQLLDVELLSQRKELLLRVTIFKDDGVSLDDCAEVQKAVSDKLDEMDPIPGSYTLEVSSPGLERTLKRDREYSIYKGRLCQVSLFAPVNGERVYRGKLAGLWKGEDGQEVVGLETESGRVLLPRSNVSKVQLVYDEKVHS